MKNVYFLDTSYISKKQSEMIVLNWVPTPYPSTKFDRAFPETLQSAITETI